MSDMSQPPALNNTPNKMLDYYQQNHFNPVPIEVEDQGTWETHFAKRVNLYQRHLGIPMSLLRNSTVLEFGCNSGENALVLASLAANLTLVEPNGQVLERLHSLFNHFGLGNRMEEFAHKDIESFQTESLYDIVMAEGFLSTLPNRDQMAKKIFNLVVPGGLAIIFYIDRYGALLEMTKRLVLWRACQLSGVNDTQSPESLDLARRLFAADFSKINASRPFEVWWKDMVVAPYFATSSLWSCPEILTLGEQSGCEFYSSSPLWSSVNHFSWYKDIPDMQERHARLLQGWSHVFPYFLTGLNSPLRETQAAPQEVIDSVADLVAQMSDATQPPHTIPIDYVEYPTALDDYLRGLGEPVLARFNLNLKGLIQATRTTNLQDLVQAYHDSGIGRLWGTPGVYICFSKHIDSKQLG